MNIRRRLRVPMLMRLAADKRGIAVVEFAFVAPVLIALYLGSYQLCDAISASRKVTTTARTVADLASQFSAVSDSDLDIILNASNQVMAPYSPSSAKLTVTQVKIDASGNATVDWSRGLNTTKLTKDAPYTLPESIRTANTSLIVARVSFNYVPTMLYDLLGPIPFSDTIIMSPRSVVSIIKKVN
jgi:Flp pilus assembly protein TadG